MNPIAFEVLPEPDEWLILFHPRSSRWVERLCPGKFKHVSAVGFVADAKAWALLSWELGRLRVSVMTDADFEVHLAAVAPDAGILKMMAPQFDLGPWRPRLGLFCVSMVTHLLGLRGGALLPDALWRLLLANGAEIVSLGRFVPSEDYRPRAVGG